jgi:hypothetical protein
LDDPKNRAIFGLLQAEQFKSFKKSGQEHTSRKMGYLHGSSRLKMSPRIDRNGPFANNLGRPTAFTILRQVKETRAVGGDF